MLSLTLKLPLDLKEALTMLTTVSSLLPSNLAPVIQGSTLTLNHRDSDEALYLTLKVPCKSTGEASTISASLLTTLGQRISSLHIMPNSS